MLETIPNLWVSVERKSNGLKPAAILRAHAAQLSRMTQGVLRGEVMTVKGERQELLNLNIVAPTLNHFRHRFLSVQYERGKDYPVTVSAQALSVVEGDEETDCHASFHTSRPQSQNAKTKPVRKSVDSKEARSGEEFVKILKEVLQAPETLDLLQRLIVRSNEMTAGDAEAIETANADAIAEAGVITDKAA